MKKKKKIIICICGIVVISVVIILNMQYKMQADSSSVIGAADGPTSILVSDNIGKQAIYIIVGIIIIAFLGIVFKFRSKK